MYGGEGGSTGAFVCKKRDWLRGANRTRNRAAVAKTASMPRAPLNRRERERSIRHRRRRGRSNRRVPLILSDRSSRLR